MVSIITPEAVRQLQLSGSSKEWRRLVEWSKTKPREIRKYIYDTYLASAAWDAKRQLRLYIDDYKCEDDGAIFHLEVHHLTYARECAETDLITLCEFCHGQRHGLERGSPQTAKAALGVALSDIKKQACVPA